MGQGRVRFRWAAAAFLVAGSAWAEPSDRFVRPRAPAGEAAERAEAALREQARREDSLAEVRGRLAASAETRRRLEAEVAALAADRGRLQAALVETAAATQAAEERVARSEERLSTLGGSETALRASLDARRGTVAEVLAALQRMGRRPPPAVLVRADDILAAVRSSTLLGAAVPGLQEQAAALAADLARLSGLRAAVAAEAAVLREEAARLAAERDRLDALVRARQDGLATAERAASGERARAVRLGTEARSLKDLVDRTELEAAAARRAAAESRRLAEADAREAQERFATAAVREPTRLGPRQAFAELRGALPRPAAGPLLRAFGVADGAGGATRGIVYGARPRAVVTASADGWIVFAGPFRSYGRLLIINAGDGYHLLLAGMDQISVDVGQFVLAGEPVGLMGEAALPSAAMGIMEADGPVLYVELRKDGGPIDPGPWWAKSQSERARG